MSVQEFIEYIEQFKQHLAQDLLRSPHTIRAYTKDLTDLLPTWELHPDESFKKVVYLYFHQRMKKNDIDKKTMARKISCLNSFVKYVSSTHGVVIELDLQRPAIQEQMLDYITEQEITFLLDELSLTLLPTRFPHRDKAIFELLYATGIRPSELIYLTLHAINVQTRTLTITNSRKAPRVVLFGSKAAQQLEQYLTYERKKIDSAYEHIFLNHTGEPLSSRSIQRICNMFGTFLNRTLEITPSLLRHSCAIHLLQNGSSLELVRELLGTTRMSAEKYLVYCTPKNTNCDE